MAYETSNPNSVGMSQWGATTQRLSEQQGILCEAVAAGANKPTQLDRIEDMLKKLMSIHPELLDNKQRDEYIDGLIEEKDHKLFRFVTSLPGRRKTAHKTRERAAESAKEYLQMTGAF